MSGLETVKIIVEAEKEAARTLENAQAKASEIHKQLYSLIETERQELVRSTEAETSMIMRQAEAEGKTQAQEFEKNSQSAIQQRIAHASTQKAAAVERLVALVMESEQ